MKNDLIVMVACKFPQQYIKNIILKKQALIVVAAWKWSKKCVDCHGSVEMSRDKTQEIYFPMFKKTCLIDVEAWKSLINALIVMAAWKFP